MTFSPARRSLFRVGGRDMPGKHEEHILAAKLAREYPRLSLKRRRGIEYSIMRKQGKLREHKKKRKKKGGKR